MFLFFFRKILVSLDVIRSREKFIYLLLLSLLINFLMFFMMFIIIKSMGIDLSLWQVFFGGTLVLLTTILPIQGILGLGTFEVGWVLFFTLFNFSREISITTGFVYHTIFLIFTIILFIFGLLNLLLKYKD